MKLEFTAAETLPKVFGFERVLIMQPCRQPNAMIWEVRWMAVRAKDGLELHGRFTFTELDLVRRPAVWREFKQDILNALLRTVQSYADCECRVWWDTHTRQTYLIDCEQHATQGYSSVTAPSEGIGEVVDAN